jgi:hypothetical protein
MAKDFQVHDFIEDFPSQYDEDIQWKVTERKEFYELVSTPGGKDNLPTLSSKDKVGRFFNHQEFLLRYARQYDRIFNIQATGTGKSGGIINLAEFYKKNNYGIKRIYVIQPGSSTKDSFKEQIKTLSDPGEYLNQKVIKAMESEGGQKRVKNNINRLINEWYSIDSYKIFAKENYSSKQIEEYYSDSIFFLDEAHWFRNTGSSGGAKVGDDATKKEIEEVYNYFWKIFHTAKRIKVIIATATPMINSTSDFVPLINLLLPADRQLPDYIDYDRVTLEQLEPYFRGLFTFIRFDNRYINPIDVGESIEGYTHIITVASNAKGNSPPIEPVVKKIENDKIVVVKSPPYKEGKTKKIKIQSFVKLVKLRMSKHQYKTFSKHSKVRKNFDYYSVQSSLFVFPNGSTGRDGERIYLDINSKKNLTFRLPNDEDEDGNVSMIKKRIEGKFIKVKSLDNYFSKDKPEKSLENLKMMSCKFHYYISNELKFSKRDKPGKSFCYIKAVTGSGANLLALFLKLFGFDELKNVGSIHDTRSDRIVGIKKRKRFAVLTAETPDTQSIINVFSSPDNRDGEYIQIIIGSGVVRDSVSLKDTLRGYMMIGNWHQAGTHQAESRYKRAESHKDMFIREGHKIDVKTYRLVAVPPDYSDKGLTYENAPIDIKNYIKSEEKDIYDKLMFRKYKQTAIDAYLNYTRNVLPTDIDGSPQADYSDKYFKIWGAQEPPSSRSINELPKPDRSGLALNQGPNGHDIIYNTYNIMYAEEVIKKVKKEVKEVFKERGVIQLEEFKEQLLGKGVVSNDYTFYGAIQEMIEGREIITDSRNIIDYVLTISGDILHLKRFNFHISDRVSTEKNIYFDFNYGDLKEKEQEIGDIYKDMEKLNTKVKLISYYIYTQDYKLFQSLLEDSIIRQRNDGDENLMPVNDLILEVLDNYILETKVPYGYLEVTKQALKGSNKSGQGRTRGDESIAGLKYVNLDKVEPGYLEEPEDGLSSPLPEDGLSSPLPEDGLSSPLPEDGLSSPSSGGKKVYVHFYRPSEKTGFGITSILEGKDRKIRILDGDNFRDADAVENFVYNYLFNRKYDHLMNDFRKSKYYGSYIMRGGETEKDIVKREQDFFRIVDNSNPRNKGLTCTSGVVDRLKEVLKWLDKDGEYKHMLTNKVKKKALCPALKQLLIKKNLLFMSL